MFMILIPNQGDQIGRIFAHWVLVYFGQIFDNSNTHFGHT
jgi:hypothetical protein